MWSLQHESSGVHTAARAPSRQEDAAAQPGIPDELNNLHTAHCPSRQEAAQQRSVSHIAGGSSDASMPYGTMVSAGCCDGRTHCIVNAFQHSTRHHRDQGRSCSPQQAEQCAVLTGFPDRRLGNSHPAYTAASSGTDTPCLKPRSQPSAGSAHGRHRHDAELSKVAVTISRSTLRAVMRALAKGLADIRELRRAAKKAGLLSDLLPPSLCDRPASSHDERPGTQTPATEAYQLRRLSASRPHGSAQQGTGLQGSQHSAGSRGSRTAEHGSRSQRPVAWPVGHTKKSHLPQVQPTGHPMVRWWTSLRSPEPPCCTHVSSARKPPKLPSASGPSMPASQRDKSKDLPCSSKSCTGVTPQSAEPERRRTLPNERRVAEESCGHGVALQHARLHAQDTHLDHKHASTARLEAGVMAEQQGLIPPSSPQPCQQHLRQRYLPVYSVFDDNTITADGAEELLCAHLTEQCTPKAADTAEAAVDAAQQRQIGNMTSLQASSASTHADEACKVQRPDVHGECNLGQSEHTAVELPGVQEDILRAALQDFAMRVA